MSEATRSVVASREVSRLNVRGSVRAETGKLAAARRGRRGAAARRSAGRITLVRRRRTPPAPRPWPRPQAPREVGRVVWSKSGSPANSWPLKFPCNSTSIANLRAIGEVAYMSEIRRPNGWPTSLAAELFGFCRGRIYKLRYHNDLHRDPVGLPHPALGAGIAIRPATPRRINGFGRADFRTAASRATYRPQRLLDHAADLLGVSRRTIYNRIRDGRLLTVRTIGGSQRVLIDSVEANPAPPARARPFSGVRLKARPVSADPFPNVEERPDEPERVLTPSVRFEGKQTLGFCRSLSTSGW